jgi:hypothetical protein
MWKAIEAEFSPRAKGMTDKRAPACTGVHRAPRGHRAPPYIEGGARRGGPRVHHGAPVHAGPSARFLTG